MTPLEAFLSARGIGPGGFSGTFGGPGDGNFTRPDSSGAPNIYGANGQVSGSQIDYTLLFVAVYIVVVAVIVGASVLLVRKKKSGKSALSLSQS